MKLFDQCWPRWAGEQLGTVSGTICQYGCLMTDFTAIANDSGNPMDPDLMNKLFIAKKVYVEGDLLVDNALDLAYPGEYQTTHYTGYRADIVKAGVLAKDTYVILWISGYSPGWKVNVATHFVIAWTSDGTYIGDPNGGTVRPLSWYGGSANVHKTTMVKRLRPAPPPPPPPPAPPPPPMLYFVRQAGSTIAIGSSLAYDAAVTVAHGAAAAHIGILYEVVDAKGNVVDTEFVAPPPAPVPPGPAPMPTPLPSPPADLWSWLNQFIIALILLFKQTQQ